MPRKYVKVEDLAEEVFQRKAAGETNREIAESHGLTKYQIKQLVARQNRKRRLIERGYVPRPKGPPEKTLIMKQFVKRMKSLSCACR